MTPMEIASMPLVFCKDSDKAPLKVHEKESTDPVPLK
jgi:hypothetical protein